MNIAMGDEPGLRYPVLGGPDSVGDVPVVGFIRQALAGKPEVVFRLPEFSATPSTIRDLSLRDHDNRLCGC